MEDLETQYQAFKLCSFFSLEVPRITDFEVLWHFYFVQFLHYFSPPSFVRYSSISYPPPRMIWILPSL